VFLVRQKSAILLFSFGGSQKFFFDMAPPKYKSFKFETAKTFAPANQSLGNLQPSYDQYYQGGNPVYQNQRGPGSGYQSPNGATTPLPRSGPASSTTSLSSLASALKEIEKSPVSEFFETIRDAKTLADIRTAAGALVEVLFQDGPESIERYLIHEHVVSLSKAKGSPLLREGSMLVLSTIARKFGSQNQAEAFLLSSFCVPFDLLADKENSVKRAAQGCSDSLFAVYGAEAKVSSVLTKILEYLDSSAKWQSKIGALKAVEKIITSAPQDYLEFRFVDAIPVLTNVMHDMKPELSKAGTKALTDFAGRLDNQDIVPRIPVIVGTLNDPKKVPDCIKTLSHVTFVTEVTESALSLLVPILNRALNLSSTSQDSLRQTVIVVENLTRLVHNPREVKHFIPQLLPGVQKVVNTASLPEVRELAAKALKVLEAAGEEEAHKTRITAEEAMEQVTCENLTLKDYAAGLVTIAVNSREFRKLADIYQTYTETPDIDERVNHFKSLFKDTVVEDDGEEGIEIVNAEFSLAYGGRMLLNKTVLRLFKGRRYGLCGRNGAGKSTLMRSIAEGKLEGFPDKSELKSCFVEHKLQGSEADMDLVGFIASDPELVHVEKSDIAAALEEVGFDEMRRGQNVGALSGGWKMKLELARAMLMKADILLLDEPTNHLDVTNVKWLEDYLNTHTNITSLIVSHDSGFLDAVCTDIIHYESKKLVYYKGNLSE
jgi:elongation factor 3